MITIVEFQKNDVKYINDFLKLPIILYSKEELMEDKTSVKSILKENHVLNKYFKICGS